MPKEDHDLGSMPPPHNWASTAIVLACVVGGFVLIGIVLITVPEAGVKTNLITAILLAIPVFIGSILSTVNSAEAARNSRRNSRRIRAVHDTLDKTRENLDGKLDDLIHAKAKTAFAAGKEVGQEQGRAIEKEISEALTTPPPGAATVPPVIVVTAPPAAGVPDVVPDVGPAAQQVSGMSTVVLSGENLSAQTTKPNENVNSTNTEEEKQS